MHKMNTILFFQENVKFVLQQFRSIVSVLFFKYNCYVVICYMVVFFNDNIYTVIKIKKHEECDFFNYLIR